MSSDNHRVCFCNRRSGQLRLRQIVVDEGAQQQICVSDNFQRLKLSISSVAAATAIASLISPIVKRTSVFPARQPNRSSILPFAGTALSSPRPLGSSVSSIFSPGRTRKCLKHSFRSVNCPLSVTVKVAIPNLHPHSFCNALMHYLVFKSNFSMNPWWVSAV
jgi:hypothetical protein